MILLECPETGERQLVRNAVGYRGWKLISRQAPMPPSDHCNWCYETGRWIADKKAQTIAAHLANMRDPQTLLAIIEELQERISALEAKEK